MSFQNPSAFLWLAPLAGVIVALYLLRMRRRDLRVPATFLWPAKTEEVRANALIQRLRFSWLLILQLLALCLAIAAFARPQIRQRGLAGEATVFIVDASASMGAIDVKPTRLDEAIRLVREAIESAKPGDRIAVIEAGPSPRVIVPLTNDPGRALPALDSLQRYDCEIDVGPSLRLAAALIGAQSSARIVLLADGVFEPVKDFAPGKAAVVYRRIGESAENLAISALGTTDSPSGRKIYCAVRSYGTTPMGGPITIFADGHPIDSERIAVQPGLTWGKTLDAPAGAKIFEAKLDSKDVLASDNYAVSIADPGAAIHVLLLGKGDLFLERALALDPRVTLDRATELPASMTGYDLVVFDGVPEQPVPARGVLTFGAAGSASPVTVQGTVKQPTYVNAEDSPVLKAVDLNGIYIEQAQRIQPKADGEVLAIGSAGPLIVAARGTQRHLYVSFEPLHSDFPLQAAFPIFISNALDFLAGEGASGALAVRAGSTFSLPANQSATIDLPDGSRQRIDPVAGSVVVRSLRTVGIYRLSVGNKAKQVFATLRSDRASNVRPVSDVALGGGNVHNTEAPARFADFWRALALLLLAVLGGEWWLFARRS